jgi:hypothetical protein
MAKILIMGTHWDALNLPEGVERVPHEHEWVATRDGARETERFGRPVCTRCGGKPSFFELREIDDADSEATALLLESGSFIKIEREAEPDQANVAVPNGPESGDLQGAWNDLKEALNLPKLTDDKLREFIDDFVSNRIFTTAHLSDAEADLIPSIFLPIALGCFSKVQPDTLSQIGVIYEYYEKAGPRSINGKPSFFSFHMLHIEDWDRARPAIVKEIERRKNIDL